MSEAVFDHSEGLTNFDYRLKCNIILLWSAIWSVPGIVLAKITGSKSQNSDGSNSNPVANAIGNLFGGEEKSKSASSLKNSASNSNLAQREMMQRQMMNRNSNSQMTQSNNSPMGQTSQAADQAIRERRERERLQQVVKSNISKGNQI